MPVSDAKKRANAKYSLKAYDRIELKVKKGRKADLQAHAAAQGESLNAFVNRAIDETVERESSSTSLLGPSEGMVEESPQVAPLYWKNSQSRKVNR
ncbi:MAG: hypothetical protein LBC56_04530 [Oscillospiraceae bacterium]|jgi:hypothetical protein|nr:hypothetical protein [Oscillospiraceae bacterium]